jgi:hypothetical protein
MSAVTSRDTSVQVGGVAIEFCVHIGRPEVLFEDVFDKFTAVGHQGIDALYALPPSLNCIQLLLIVIHTSMTE